MFAAFVPDWPAVLPVWGTQFLFTVTIITVIVWRNRVTVRTTVAAEIARVLPGEVRRAVDAAVGVAVRESMTAAVEVITERLKKSDGYLRLAEEWDREQRSREAERQRREAEHSRKNEEHRRQIEQIIKEVRAKQLEHFKATADVSDTVHETRTVLTELDEKVPEKIATAVVQAVQAIKDGDSHDGTHPFNLRGSTDTSDRGRAP